MLIDFNQLNNQQQESDGKIMIAVGDHSFPVSTNLKDLKEALRTNNTAHWVSNGDWSMHEMLLMLVQGWENASVYISSYGFSDKPARVIAELVNKQGLKLHCLIDNRIDTRSASALTILKNCCTQLKMTDTHAKVTVVEMKNRVYTVIGSANYTENKRYEAGIVTTVPAAALFHKKWIEDELARA